MALVGGTGHSWINILINKLFLHLFPLLEAKIIQNRFRYTGLSVIISGLIPIGNLFCNVHRSIE